MVKQKSKVFLFAMVFIKLQKIQQDRGKRDGTTFEYKEVTLQLLKDYVLYSLNVCCTNEIQTNSQSAMLALRCDNCVASLSFTDPLLWPHDVVKSPLDVHFSTFSLYCFMHTVNLGLFSLSFLPSI